MKTIYGYVYSKNILEKPVVMLIAYTPYNQSDNKTHVHVYTKSKCFYKIFYCLSSYLLWSFFYVTKLLFMFFF